jgi:PAS domain S-box-containing protein
MPTEVERLREGMRVLSAAIAAVAEATTDSQRLLDTLVRQAADLIHDTCVVLLQSPDGPMAAALYDPDPVLLEELRGLYAKPLGEGAVYTNQAMQTGKPVLVPAFEPDAMRGRISPEMFAMFERIGLRGSMVVPMRVQGEPYGVLAILRHRLHHRELDELDLAFAQDLANHAAIAIANARRLDALRENEELRRAKEDLSRANSFLDAIIENIPDMVFVKDAVKLAFTRFNRAGEELIGVSRDAMLGKTDYDFFPPEEAMHFQSMDHETLRNKKLVEILEEPIHTANGKRWLHTKKVPILDESGVPRYLLGISQDITNAKQHQQALLDAKERAEAANKELEAFSYSVAHDLRAPLRAIDGFSQSLFEDYGDRLDEEGHRYLQRVREQAQRMAMLIDDLLALSRVTRHELSPETVDLGEVARTVVAQLQRDGDRDVDVHIATNLTTQADPRMIAIAFDNLIGNAWKFTSKTPAARIEVGQLHKDSERVFYIRDNGAGFDPQYGHKLFGVFQRLHTEREFPGTGIGLATVARIILRHRGRVWAEAQPGMGATFFFTLGDPEAP